ncbi:MAG: PAS domain S-box protein [Planctomycetia bacterium]|nr:PAS domain S-box protein [Planctomycetia bacterium]
MENASPPGRISPSPGFDARELELLRVAAGAAFDSIVITDREGTIVFVNPAFERVSGWSSSEALGKTPRILKSGAHPVDFYRTLWGTLLGGGTWSGTLLNRRKNGEFFPQQLNISPVKDGSGRVSHFVSIGRDVSDRLNSARDSSEQQGVFEQILESLGDVAFLVDIRSRKFLYVSPTYERITGFPTQDLLEKTRAILTPVLEEDRPRIGALLDQESFSGDIELSYRIHRADGELRELQAKAWLVRDVHGEPVRFAGTLRDVTEFRTKERELAQSESLLRQAQKMEAIGRLAGGVAHDFNNMLTAILGYGELLEDGIPANSAMRACLAEVLKAGRRAAELTRRLLAFSRKQMLDPEPLDLGHVAKDLEPMVRRLIGEDVSLEVAVAQGLPPVWADRGQVEQVLMNLAVNARDAMPGGGALRISMAETVVRTRVADHGFAPPPGRHVRVEVADSGSGMTEEVKAHLFEPFYTTKSPGKGTGLGLAMVHGILKQSGGGITVESATGRGTKITFYLPVSDHAPRTSFRSEDAASRNKRGTGTVLVAEDEDLVRRLVVETLESAGFRVLAAHDGQEALELAGAEPGAIRLLVTDLIMPRLGGGEAARLLKEKRPDLGVLFISGYTEETLAQEIVGREGHAFLAKPFSPRGLLKKVWEVLEDGRTARPG